MNKAILFLVVLAACGGNPDAAMNEKAAPNEHVSVEGSDAGTETSVDYLDGRDGKDGKDGAPGAVGPQGPQGDVGPQGPKGVAGATGAQGLPGAIGVSGPQGSQGIQGVPGAVGPQGPTGPMGAPGSQGLKGVDGSNGAVGAIGPQGPQGIPGAVGSAGPKGAAGLDGASGAGGYWIDSTGARAPIVNVGGTNANSLYYVHTDGVMYQINPMTGRLQTSREILGFLLWYFEGPNCTGRSWYRFAETDSLSPMVAVTLKLAGVPSTYVFSRNVKLAYSYDRKMASFPNKMGSYITQDAKGLGVCITSVQDWPATAINYNGNNLQLFYYVAYEDVVAVSDPNTINKPTVPPYRFVPNL